MVTEDANPLPHNTNSNYEPDATCIQITENVAYNYQPEVGFPLCLYLRINNNAITEFFAINQTNNRQVDLVVLHDVMNSNSYSVVSQSTSSGTADTVKIFTEPGHYYAVFQPQIEDGGSILVGAAVNENKVDQYEKVGASPSYDGNATTPYPFPNGTLSGYHAFLHDATDVDMYMIQSYWGQDLSLRLSTFSGQEAEFIFEIFSNGGWVTLVPNMLYNINGLSTFSDVIFRVRAAGQTLTSGYYSIDAGSRVVGLENQTPDGDRAARISGPDYQRVQNLKNFAWKVKAIDSTGNPVRSIRISMEYFSEGSALSYTNDGITDYFGVAQNSTTLQGCSGLRAFPNEQTSPHIRYNRGDYQFRAIPSTTGSNSESVFITGVESWIHLCDEYQSYP